MTERKKDIQNEGEGRKRGIRRGLRRFLMLVFTLIVVLGVVLVAAYRDGTGFDVLRRHLNYSSTEKSADSKYHYDASAQNRFAMLGDSLVVMSDTSLRLIGRGKEELWSVNFQMDAPALTTGGGRAAAYDVGGTQMYVVDEKGELHTFTTDEEEPYISVTLNDSGWMAVTSEKENYKGCVSVYNAEMELVFAFHSSRRFVADAYVSDDCKHLAAVTLGQEDGSFVSSIVLYDLSQTEPVADYTVKDGLVLAIGEQAGKIVTVSDNKLTLAGMNAEIAGEYLYSDRYLREYDLQGDGYTVLLLNRYQSGSVGKLVSIDAEGTEVAALDVNEEILSVSAAGRYVAVLYTDSLVIYNQDLKVYATLKGTGSAREALVRADGSALLISAESARLFIP